MSGKQRLIRVSAATGALADSLRDQLSVKTGGLRFTLGDVTRRALEALRDAHHANAWLSPAESSVAFERRPNW